METKNINKQNVQILEAKAQDSADCIHCRTKL